MSSGIPPAEVAATLRLATTEVDERLGRMLRTLERLEPDHPHPDR
jgi:DNA-directed RNA polymerase specialized sigma24 family protein